MKAEDIKKLSNAQAIVLCNELGIPEGSKEQMIEALLGYDPSSVEPED